jgi:hypothetical protein
MGSRGVGRCMWNEEGTSIVLSDSGWNKSAEL